MKHREPVFPVTVTTTTLTTLSNRYINAANQAMFPWLGPIARMFEAYRFKSLSFEFVPTAPTTYTGGVVMAIDYDSSDYAVDPDDIFKYETAYQGPAFVRHKLTLPASRLAGDVAGRYSWMTEKDSTATGVSRRSNDFGILYVGSWGTTYGPIGHLYVEYVVELLGPQVPPVMPTVFSMKGAGVMTNALPWGGVPDKAAKNTVDITVEPGSGGVDTYFARFLDKGVYLVEMLAVGTALGLLTMNSTGAGVTATPLSMVVNAAATAASSIYRIVVDHAHVNPGLFTAQIPGAGAAISSSVLRLMHYSDVLY